MDRGEITRVPVVFPIANKKELRLLVTPWFLWRFRMGLNQRPP